MGRPQERAVSGLLRGLQREPTLLTLPFWTSSLQNGEKTNLADFKTLRVGHFMTLYPRKLTHGVNRLSEKLPRLAAC